MLAGDGRWADTADMGEQAARWAAASCAAASCAMAAVTPILARGLQGAPGVRYDVLHTWDALVPPVYAVATNSTDIGSANGSGSCSSTSPRSRLT
jgi:hypothetical protein